jgi:hypothetical protein
MDIWLVLVLLSEDGGRELALDALAIDMGPTKLDGFVERKLSARKDTNCRFESDGAASENCGLPICRPRLRDVTWRVAD